MGHEPKSTEHIRGGNVLLARSIRESELWGWDSEHLRLWIYLLTSVNAGKPRNVGGVEVGYGQWLRSYSKVAEDCQHIVNRSVKTWGKSRVMRMLARLRAAGMISLRETDLGTLITVQNFAHYQDFASYRPGLGTGLGTDLERTWNHNDQSYPLSSKNTATNSAVGKSVLAFCERVGSRWSLKQAPDRWAASLGTTYPHADLSAEIARAGDWMEEALASGKRKSCTNPTSFLHNWLKRAESDRPNSSPSRPNQAPAQRAGSVGGHPVTFYE
jgi:hypothetical protein